MKLKVGVIIICAVLLGTISYQSSRCESLKDIENDITKLDREVEQIRKSLETLASTIGSPEASRIIFYLYLPTGTPLPDFLKIYLNDRLEYESTLKDAKKEKNFIIPFDTFFIPGNYNIKVIGSIGGNVLEGKIGKNIDLKPGEKEKILISPVERAGKRLLSVKTFN